MSKYVFIEYEHKWASGHNKKCVVSFLSESLDEGKIPEWWIDDKIREHSSSDKYCGINCSLIEKPSEEWINKELKNTIENRDYLNQYINFLAELK